MTIFKSEIVDYLGSGKELPPETMHVAFELDLVPTGAADSAKMLECVLTQTNPQPAAPGKSGVERDPETGACVLKVRHDTIFVCKLSRAHWQWRFPDDQDGIALKNKPHTPFYFCKRIAADTVELHATHRDAPGVEHNPFNVYVMLKQPGGAEIKICIDPIADNPA